jgi:hypothetical protein
MEVAGAAVGAVSSAVAVRVAGRRWLSFLRLGDLAFMDIKEIIEQNERTGRIRKRDSHREAFKTFDRRELTKMDDKALAHWQSDFVTDEPQWILAEHEWQRRITAEQISATVSAARWQAWFVIFGAIIGSLITLIAQVLAR